MVLNNVTKTIRLRKQTSLSAIYVCTDRQRYICICMYGRIGVTLNVPAIVMAEADDYLPEVVRL